MDIRFRNGLRGYAVNPTDEAAHQVARSMLHIHGQTDLMEQFYDAYWWLFEHKLFKSKGSDVGESYFPECLSYAPQKVDPVTRRIEDDKSKNTHVEIWLEVTIYQSIAESGITEENGFLLDSWRITGVPTHDYELDCGGDSLEEALIKLALLVDQHHPNPKYPLPPSLQELQTTHAQTPCLVEQMS